MYTLVLPIRRSCVSLSAEKLVRRSCTRPTDPEGSIRGSSNVLAAVLYLQNLTQREWSRRSYTRPTDLEGSVRGSSQRTDGCTVLAEPDAESRLFELSHLERTCNNVHDKCTFLVSNSPPPCHLFTQTSGPNKSCCSNGPSPLSVYCPTPDGICLRRCHLSSTICPCLHPLCDSFDPAHTQCLLLCL